MSGESTHAEVAGAMHQINQAWLAGRVRDMAALVHPEIVMVAPGFAGRARGQEQFLAGFDDFCRNATIHEYRDHDQQVDVVGDTAVIAFQFEMVYEISSGRYRSTGRDLWVFQKHDDAWIAVWRTMLDIEERAA
jgi:hypothetical protein